MKHYRKIDENGLFVEDILLDSIPTDEEGNPDPQYIAEPVPPGFYWPKWNGFEWVEGGQAPEPVHQELTLDDRTAALENALLMIMME